MYCYISWKYISLYGVIYPELYVICFDNNPNCMTRSFDQIKSTDTHFHACYEIFNVISRSLESNHEIKFNK